MPEQTTSAPAETSWLDLAQARGERARRAVAEPPRSSGPVHAAARRALRSVLRGVLLRLVESVHELAAGVDELAAHAREVDEDARRSRTRLDRLEDDTSTLPELARRMARIEARADELARASAAPGPSDVAAAAPAGEAVDGGMLDDDGYTRFEARFRGTPEQIRERQHDALVHVSGLAGGERRLLDVGCGRGEWLEVVRDAGIPGFGVDSNPSMLAVAREAGLEVHEADVIEFVRQLPPDELGALTGFHLVEHLPLGVLAAFVDACVRVLAPGGVLVLETPNPTNVMVGSASFYLDPTHVRPLPPLLLAFLVEDRGMTDVQVHYVHPADQSLVSDPATDGPMLAAVSNAFFGPQDYVLVARKPLTGDAA